ncbi:MAG: NAD(P)H-hydrate epimerase, partial [Thermomicrobium sp.]|nr:NAD(P)H-hydrate epimerase [Thermomicrobium sp.]
MDRLCRVAEVRRAEEDAIGRGTTLADLMARAGRAVAEEIDTLVRVPADRPRHVVFLIGPGNNGGDGLVAAAHLAARGWACSLWTWNRAAVGSVPVEDEALARCRWLRSEELDQALGSADVIVDAIFGLGGKPELPEAVAQAFALAWRARQHHGALLVAVDVPSGIDADTGQADPRAFRADLTLMLGMPKIGAYLPPAFRYTGVIRIVDIGLPTPPFEEGDIGLLAEDDVREWLPR